MPNKFKIYSNENVLGTLTSMISSGRLSHAFLLFGEKGLGKKTIAKYMAAQIMCNNGNGIPCGECKDCKMIFHGSHPDVKWIAHTTESKGFSVKNLREICLDAYISPNEGSHKIYIFADCDKMSVPAQNTLLKLIEEPPTHAHFIFTATSKSIFLPTIISRVISLGVNEVSIEDCKNALFEKGLHDEDKIEDALSAFGGNIGMCLDYMDNEELQKAVSIAKNITDKLLASEYELLKAIFALDGNKQLTKTVISLLCNIIRDSTTIRLGNNTLIGCYEKGSKSLAKSLTLKQTNNIFEMLNEVTHKIDGNANLSITLTSICSNIKNTI